MGLVVSSVVAGLATAPIAAAHFNQIPHYGLIANLLSVPLMGAIIMPAAVLAALLAPFGLHHLGLWIMDPPIRWIVGVADRIAGWDGALSFVHAPPGYALPVFALGCLVVILWRHPTRAVGAAMVVAAVALWANTPRPPVLVSDTGGLVGVMKADGRVLSKPRGDGFSARSWLENDGDPVVQAGAADRADFTGEAGARVFQIGSMRVVHLTGRGARERLSEACEVADIVVYSGEAENLGACNLFDQSRLRATGALAIFAEGDGVRIVTAADRAGQRLWNMGTRR